MNNKIQTVLGLFERKMLGRTFEPINVNINGGHDITRN